MRGEEGSPLIQILKWGNKNLCKDIIGLYQENIFQKCLTNIPNYGTFFAKKGNKYERQKRNRFRRSPD